MTRLDVCRPQTNWLAIKSQMCNAMRSVLSRRLIFRGWYLALGYSRIWVKFPRSYRWYGARYADPTSEISPQPQPPLPGFPTVLYFSNFVFLTSFGFWNCCLLFYIPVELKSVEEALLHLWPDLWSELELAPRMKRIVNAGWCKQISLALICHKDIPEMAITSVTLDWTFKYAPLP